jgi:hypothetical protein
MPFTVGREAPVADLEPDCREIDSEHDRPALRHHLEKRFDARRLDRFEGGGVDRGDGAGMAAGESDQLLIGHRGFAEPLLEAGERPLLEVYHLAHRKRLYRPTVNFRWI